MDQQPDQKPSISPLTPTPNSPNSSPLSEQMNAPLPLTNVTSSVPEASKRPSVSEVRQRAKKYGITASVVVAVIVVFAIGWYLVKGQNHTVPFVQKPLTDTDLQKLSVGTIGYSNNNQLLTFHSPAAFDKDLKVGGSASIKDLTVTGTFTHNATTVQKALEITGDTLLHGTVTAKGLMRVDGNLIVGGTSVFNGAASFNSGANFSGALSAESISVKSATIGGLTFGHVITTGLTPASSVGIGAGGGSVQVSGNDTTGTVTINVGGGAHTGDIANITFRSAFSSTPHINLTPVGASSAGAPYYVTRSATAFTIGIVNPVPGVTYIFDYFVTQ